MKYKQSIILWVFLLFVLVGASGPIIYPQLTKQQQAGKDIYTKGSGVTDIKITANMSGVSVPATVMACINCHNAEGTGNPEGGITPSNITWTELTKSYGGKRQDQRKRPAYNERTLRNAISLGIDSGGNELHSAMPRYTMSREDMDNLIDYLKVLGNLNEKGITDQAIRIGISLPNPTTHPNGKNEAIQQMVYAYCNELNEKGGIYNRSIQPYFFKNSSEFDENDYFMVLGQGSLFVQEKVNQAHIPSLLSHTKNETEKGLNNPYAFYLYPSLASQNSALFQFSQEKGILSENSTVSIVYEETDQHKMLIQNIADNVEENFGKRPQLLPLDQTNKTKISKNPKISSKDLVFYIGSPQFGNELLKLFSLSGKTPYILVPGNISAINLFHVPKDFEDKIYMGYPTWLSARTREGKEQYQKINAKYTLPKAWKRNQWEILSQLIIAEEILKRAGKNLYQDQIKESFEGMFEYSNGFTPSLSYNRNKRVGSSLVYIVGLDSKQRKLKLVTTINTTEK